MAHDEHPYDISNDTGYWLHRYADVLEVIDMHSLTAEDLAPLTLHLEALHRRSSSAVCGVRPISSAPSHLAAVKDTPRYVDISVPG